MNETSVEQLLAEVSGLSPVVIRSTLGMKDGFKIEYPKIMGNRINRCEWAFPAGTKLSDALRKVSDEQEE